MKTERKAMERIAPEAPDIMEIKEPDQGVIRTLEADGGTMAFQGLRRRMNIHQEKLSRALQRLEEDGYVLHTSKGYLLTPKGSSLAQRRLTETPKAYSTILQSFLPGDISPSTMAHHLEGRWFNNLRWQGIKDEGDQIILRWVTEATGVEVVIAPRLGPGQGGDGRRRPGTFARGAHRGAEGLRLSDRTVAEDWENMQVGTSMLACSSCHRPAG